MELSYNMILRRPFPKVEMRILLVGLDGAGKTTILYQMRKLKEIVTTIPTMSFETDASYFRNTHGLIFVVDSSDHHRFQEAKDKLHSMLNKDELSDTVLLVFANKKDIPTAVDTDAITQQLDLPSLRQQIRKAWMTCATSGEGLNEGLQWLSYNIAYKEFSKIVEVKTTGPHLGYIWAPAKLIKENKDETLQVEFLTDQQNFKKKSTLVTWSLSSVADRSFSSFSEIRPSPPPFGIKLYSLSEKVDALLECGWCPGVVSEVHLGRRYSVCLGQTRQKKDFEYWQLRPRMMWKDRAWQTDEEKGSCKEQSHHAVEQDEVDQLVRLLFLGNLFTREDERDFCYSYNKDDCSLCLKDLERISKLSIMISEPNLRVVDKIIALDECINHAKGWVTNSDKQIDNLEVSYAALKEKMNKIVSSAYFKHASLKHVIDKPNYQKARTKVFWDIENTPVGEVDPANILKNIKAVLRKLGLEGPVQILGIGDRNTGAGKHWDALQKKGIELIHVDQNGKKEVADKFIMTAMMAWAFPGFKKHETPGNVVLISGDSDYTATLRELVKRKFRVILAHKKDSRKELKWSSKIYLLWDDLRNGEVPENLIKNEGLFWTDPDPSSSQGVKSP